MDDNYIVMKYNEDGDAPSVTNMSADELREKLKENYWGERPTFAQPGQNVNGDHSGAVLVIIKGEIVVPKPVQVATEWEL